jgi:hypothetical protein
MLRRALSAAAVLFVLVGFVAAETYQGLLTEISKEEATVTVRKKGEKKGEKKTFKVAKDAKFTKGKDTAVTIDEIRTMIDNAKGKVKGVAVRIVTDGEGDKETIVSISVGGGKKKKDN